MEFIQSCPECQLNRLLDYKPSIHQQPLDTFYIFLKTTEIQGTYVTNVTKQ
jgi:hypothetical protein